MHPLCSTVSSCVFLIATFNSNDFYLKDSTNWLICYNAWLLFNFNVRPKFSVVSGWNQPEHFSMLTELFDGCSLSQLCIQDKLGPHELGEI